MTTISTLSVDINGKDVNVDAMLARIDASLLKTDAGAKRTAAAFSGVLPSSMQKSTSSALALQQAQARLEAQQGNLAGAAARLRNALAQQTQTTVQTIAAKRQLLAVEDALAGKSSALASGFQSVAGSIGGLPGQLLSVGTGIGLVTAAAGAGVAVLKSFGDAFVFKAGLDATTTSIRLQLQGVRDSNQVFAQGQAFAAKYGLTQQELTDSIQSSVGVMRESNATTTDLLETLSRLQVLAPEKPISEAARALRELQSGDTTSIKELFNISAANANKMKAEIIAGGDAVQVLSRFLDTAGIGMDTLAARTEGAKGKMIELAQAQEQLTLAQARFAEGPGLAILQGKIIGIQTLTTELSGDFNTLASANQAFALTLVQTGDFAAAAAARTAVLTAATDQQTTTTTASIGPMQAAAAAQLGQASAAQIATTATQAATAETQKTAEAAVLAAAQQAAQSQATANLTASTNAAVSSFLALNPSIDAAGIAAAVAAGKIPALIGQLAQLRVSAYSARDAVAALAAQQGLNVKVLAPGGGGINAPGRTSGRNNDIDAVLALQKANKEAADAQSAQILALGTHKEKLIELEKQYADTVKTSGKDSAAAIQAQTRLELERQTKTKGTSGAGGGGVKLSDQAKLNNQLLTNQETYATKSEDAERAHVERILDINADFTERMRAAQDSLAQSQLDGRAGFYDSLGSIEDAGLRSALAAQYEAAFQEADAIAQQRGADVGEKFLEAKQSAIAAQGKRAGEIAEATKQGDKDKAAYLAGVDKLYRDAEARRLAAIAEGGGSITAERDKQLVEEGTKYEAAQGKIADSAERAEARRILSAERAGKAIDAEGLRVDALTQKYDGLGAAGARAGVTPGATPGVGATPVASAPQAPVDIAGALAALASKLDELRNAVVGAEKSGADQVSGAIGRLGNSLVR